MPHCGQWAVSLRLGIATNGPVWPSMILRSRTTKQLSNVIEQNALSRSPGSSMSLIRTSVISTVVLLTTEGSLRDTSRWQRHSLPLLFLSRHEAKYSLPQMIDETSCAVCRAWRAERMTPKYAEPLPVMPWPRHAQPGKCRAKTIESTGTGPRRRLPGD